MYHAGSRQLQDQFDSRRLADRLEQVQVHTTLTDHDRSFMQRACMFFLATADTEGRPDCSYKGGFPGFVRIVDERTLAFPDYNGNGMFRSLGNILVNPHVGLLFIDFAHPDRLRVNGIASINTQDPLLPEYPGAQLIIRVQVVHIFPNCPRYIHKLRMVKPSVYTPHVDRAPPIPNWKRWDEFRDILPRQDGPVESNFHTYLRRLEQRSPLLSRCIRALRSMKKVW
jgi:predicted pyridoxine 5'-phosphate oxidase superfamily flavin-nucleotide-binding protein